MTANISITLTAPSNTVTISSTVTPKPYVEPDVPFYLDGNGGDTYLKYNSSTSKLEVYVDGVKKYEFG